MPRPLDGLKVADFSWIGAGSYTTKLLADLGADVIKIESIVHPDSLRLAAPFKDRQPGINRSGYFADRNSSKRSITLNLKKPRAVELARALVRQSDIAANNFTPGTMERLGLGYEVLSVCHPGLIYIEMTMQGSTGPDSDALGYGLTIGALGGLQYLTGEPGREPAGTGTNYPDHIPNPCHAAFAILAAVRHQRRHGEGQRIELAQIEPLVAMLPAAVMDWTVNGRNAEPVGNRDSSGAPRGVYPCRGDDRWIAISILDDSKWVALCGVLGRRLGDRAEWSTAAMRHSSHAEIDAVVAELTAGWDAFELMQRLQGAGIPAGVVQTAADVVNADPQLAHRGHWSRLDHAETGQMLYNTLPFRLAGADISPRMSAPLLGEHTREICRDRLGLSDPEIDALIEEQVLK